MFGMNEKKLTMKDVAIAVGCHVSTVSLALRGDERIPEGTRKRVRAAAKRLGYQVHPLISAWNRSRRAGRSINCNLSLAYLGSRASEANGAAMAVYDSLQEEVDRNGFSLARFCVEDFEGSVGRLSQILKARSVSGVILGPGVEGQVFKGGDWSDFSLVALGEGPLDLLVDRFMVDAGERVFAAVKSCFEKGWRRIGFVSTNSWSLVSSSCSIAAFNAAQCRYLSVGERLPICFVERGKPGGEEVEAWMCLNRPEVLLVDAESGLGSCRVGVAQGCDMYHDLEYGTLAKAVVEYVGNLVVRNQRGVPDKRRSVLIETRRSSQGFSSVFELPFASERYLEVAL